MATGEREPRPELPRPEAQVGAQVGAARPPGTGERADGRR